jgi:hypothetical protein
VQGGWAGFLDADQSDGEGDEDEASEEFRPSSDDDEDEDDSGEESESVVDSEEEEVRTFWILELAYGSAAMVASIAALISLAYLEIDPGKMALNSAGFLSEVECVQRGTRCVSSRTIRGIISSVYGVACCLSIIALMKCKFFYLKYMVLRGSLR